MTEADAVELMADLFWTVFWVCGPALLSALVIGLVISLFQALTQIQEMTLTFVPKIFGTMVVVILTLPFSYNHLKAFTEKLFDLMIGGF